MFFGFLPWHRAKPSRTSSKPGRRLGRPRRRLTAELLEARVMLTSAPFAPNLGLLLLDPSGSHALVRSGNGGLNVAHGDIVIDSSSSSAGTITGSGNVTASNIFVGGKVTTTGTGKLSGTLYKGATPLADPLAALPVPTAPATKFTHTSFTNKTVTLSPGTYVGGIQISGNSNVTLLPGLYYLQGGGLAVSGTSKLTGIGVTIYNAPAKSSDTISISGSTSVTLSAATSGTYQGIVIFQSRTSNAPLNFGGGSALNLTGEVYAAGATVNFSGSSSRNIVGNGGSIPGAIIARDLSASGNETLTIGANSGGLTGDLAATVVDNRGGSSITSAVGNVTAGGTITYTVTVTNTGPAAAVGATVSDAFPAGIASDTFTVQTTGGAADLTHAASGSGKIADTVILPSGGALTYTVTANISGSATGTLTNTATVSPPAGFSDSNSTNNTASDTDAFGADLAITNTDHTTTAVPGSSTTYTVTITNNGPANVTGASVADLLSGVAALASDTFKVTATSGASDSTHAAGSTVYSGDIVDTVNLNAGASITYSVTAAIKSSATGSLASTAAVTPPTATPDANDRLNNSASTDMLTHADATGRSGDHQDG